MPQVRFVRPACRRDAGNQRMKKNDWQSQVGMRDWWDRLVLLFGHDFPPSKERLDVSLAKWGIFGVGIIIGAVVHEAVGPMGPC